MRILQACNHASAGGVLLSGCPHRTRWHMAKLGVDRLSELDWPTLGEQLDRWGYALTPPLLGADQCDELIDLFDVEERFRSTVVMSRHAFGEGTYRYFAEPLPPVVQHLRVELYPPLA